MRGGDGDCRGATEGREAAVMMNPPVEIVYKRDRDRINVHLFDIPRGSVVGHFTTSGITTGVTARDIRTSLLLTLVGGLVYY